MNEINKSKEINTYFKLLSKDYPFFINKYIKSKRLQRLEGIGLFCGCDYTKLYNYKYWYSRLDHSISCALMTWHFTKDKTQTLAALFHDLGTPAFSHCVDYLLDDSINQESSELDIKEVVLSSSELINLLEEDNINIDDVINLDKYTIVENKKPKICIDRLEGIITTGLIWIGFWKLEDIEYIYNNIKVLENEQREKEIGFTNVLVAELFFEGVFKYGLSLQKNENKFTLQFIADCLKILINKQTIKFADLYTLSEQDIIALIKNDPGLRDKWEVFENTDTIIKTNQEPIGEYYVSVDSKKRYVVPLVEKDNKVVRLNLVSLKCQQLLDAYLSYSDSLYAYLDFNRNKKPKNR